MQENMQQLEFAAYHKSCFESIQFFSNVSIQINKLQNMNIIFFFS